MRTAKTLIRLGGCPDSFESLLGAQPFCWFCHVAAHLSLRYLRRFKPKTMTCMCGIKYTVYTKFLKRFRAEIHKYYRDCEWSKKWAEGLQKILT